MNDGARRLLMAADAVEKAGDKFTMVAFGWLRHEGIDHEFTETSLEETECGTPACVLGHYCMLTESPWELAVRRSPTLETYSAWLRDKSSGKFLADGFDSAEVCKHFELDHEEAHELFSGFGCDEATTGEEAAEYIREFVARKWGVGPA